MPRTLRQVAALPAARAEAARASLGVNGGCVLVDDLIDSRWTVTVAGRLLRQAGADAVLPLALGSVG